MSVKPFSYAWSIPINSPLKRGMKRFYLQVQKEKVRVGVIVMVAKTGESFRSQSVVFQMSVNLSGMRAVAIRSASH